MTTRQFAAACCLGLSVLMFPRLGSCDPGWTRTGVLGLAARRTYDHNMVRVSPRAHLYREGYGSYVLHCLVSARARSGESLSFNLSGIGSPIEVEGRTFLLSAGHVFDLDDALAMRGVSASECRIEPPEYYFELQGRRFALLRVDDGSSDLALFVARSGQPGFPTGGYRCGDSDALSPGAVTLSWGMPLMEHFELSTGIVTALAAPPSLVQAGFPGAAPDDFFVTSMPTIFGCSGALVYAFRDGQPEIVGMLVAGYVNVNRSIVYKINAILRDAGIRR
jgi:hypothetical protein